VPSLSAAITFTRSINNARITTLLLQAAVHIRGVRPSVRGRILQCQPVRGANI
jgi:hypothetical protein